MAEPIVLVVDDEEDIRDTLVEYLRRALDNVGVIAAEGAHDAIRYMDLGHVDLILSDHYMPDGLGTDVLKLARERNPRTARVLMTAFPEQEVLIQATNGAHVDHIFTKPFDPPEVARIVSDLLEQRGVYPERTKPGARVSQ